MGWAAGLFWQKHDLSRPEPTWLAFGQTTPPRIIQARHLPSANHGSHPSPNQATRRVEHRPGDPEILPPGDKEKQLLQGLLNQRKRIESLASDAKRF